MKRLRTGAVIIVVLAFLMTGAAAPVFAADDFRIQIPSLDIDLGVVTAKFVKTTWPLERITTKAAHLEGLPLPGEGGNVVIGGHSELASRRPGPFFRLPAIRFGAEIILQRKGQTFRYIVFAMWEVHPRDISVLDPSWWEMLTLITCTDYNPRTRKYDGRLIVRALRVG